MKKSTLKKLLLVTLSVAVLAGCGKKDSDKKEDKNSEVVEESSNINPPVLAAEENYASVISELKPGQAYGFADFCTDYDVLLVSEDGAYDCGNGTMGAINAKVYGLDADNNVVELGIVGGGHTAYPISVYDGCVLFANNEYVFMQYVEPESGLILTKKTAQVYYEDGVAYYYCSNMDTGFEGLADDDSMLQEMYGLYDQATVVNFTVVE